MSVNNVNSASNSSAWFNNGSTGFLNRQREIGHMGRFTPGRNNANSSPEFQRQVVSARSAADGLINAIRDMQGRGTGDSPFSTRIPTSADSNLMAIRDFDASRLRNTNVADMSVRIEQIATAQQNRGNGFDTGELAVNAGFETGSNSMTIGIDGRNFDIAINISDTDTVRDVQNRIANAINARADVDVRARVTMEEGQSRITLESLTTGTGGGTGPRFTVDDRTGNVASALGIDTITTQAQNAQFRVNRGNVTGALQTSQTNNVDLGNGINATLVAEGAVNVTMERDVTGQINAFRNLVNNFNDLAEIANAGGGRNSDRLMQDLQNFFSQNAQDLARAGISLNSSGFLAINESAMRTAAENGTLERISGDSNAGSSFGALNRLERIAEGVQRNPGNFVDASNEPNGGIDFNMFQQSRFNSIMNVGMLFDSWF